MILEGPGILRSISAYYYTGMRDVFVGILLLAIFTHSDLIKKLDPVFWLESLAVVAFGVSRLTKGEMILKDES
jgi:hypothetical protein